MPSRLDTFIVLRGDHPTLPHSEIKAIADAGGFQLKFKPSPTMIQRCSTSIAALEAIASRGHYTRYILEELAGTKASTEVKACIQDIDFIEQLDGGDFRVSLRSLKGATSDEKIKELRGRIINHVEEETASQHNIFHPDVWFRGYFSDDWFLFGRLLKGSKISTERRRPQQRPCFHPSSLQPRLAGCMVNLSRAKKGEFFLDPFCGVGSTLLEADVMGCIPVGLDISKWMIGAAKRNLIHFSQGDWGVVRGDARNPPFLPVDSIATDPPYGRTTSLEGDEIDKLYRDFLMSSRRLLTTNGHLCLAAPDYLDVSDLAVEAGFKHLESHLIRVHGSLTREIAVLQNRA